MRDSADALEIHNLSPEPADEWRRLLRFVGLNAEDRRAMSRTVEALMHRAPEMVVDTYNYLQSVPETAAVLGWEAGFDEAHLEERRRFFTVWLARVLGIDTSDEFATHLFRAGKYHAAHGPRHIHVPPAYVTTSIGLVGAAGQTGRLRTTAGVRELTARAGWVALPAERPQRRPRGGHVHGGCGWRASSTSQPGRWARTPATTTSTPWLR